MKKYLYSQYVGDRLVEGITDLEYSYSDIDDEIIKTSELVETVYQPINFLLYKFNGNYVIALRDENSRYKYVDRKLWRDDKGELVIIEDYQKFPMYFDSTDFWAFKIKGKEGYTIIYITNSSGEVNFLTDCFILNLNGTDKLYKATKHNILIIKKNINGNEKYNILTYHGLMFPDWVDFDCVQEFLVMMEDKDYNDWDQYVLLVLRDSKYNNFFVLEVDRIDLKNTDTDELYTRSVDMNDKVYEKTYYKIYCSGGNAAFIYDPSINKVIYKGEDYNGKFMDIKLYSNEESDNKSYLVVPKTYSEQFLLTAFGEEYIGYDVSIKDDSNTRTNTVFYTIKNYFEIIHFSNDKYSIFDKMNSSFFGVSVDKDSDEFIYFFDEICDISEMETFPAYFASYSFYLFYSEKIDKCVIIKFDYAKEDKNNIVSVFETEFGKWIDMVKKYDDIFFIENDGKLYIQNREYRYSKEAPKWIEVSLKSIENVDNKNIIYLLKNIKNKYNLYSAHGRSLLVTDEEQWLDGIYDCAEGVTCCVVEKDGKFSFVLLESDQVEFVGAFLKDTDGSRHDINNVFWLDDCMECLKMKDKYVDENGKDKYACVLDDGTILVSDFQSNIYNVIIDGEEMWIICMWESDYLDKKEIQVYRVKTIEPDEFKKWKKVEDEK